MNRTHTCGQLRAADAGQTVTDPSFASRAVENFAGDPIFQVNEEPRFMLRFPVS